MAEAAFTIARTEYVCPRCNAQKGEQCRMPSGRPMVRSHMERVLLIPTEEFNRRCTFSAARPAWAKKP